MVDGLFDDLLEENMLNGEELQRLREGMNLIMNRTENLVEDITGKTRKAGKIFMDCLFNPKKHLSLNYEDENEDGEHEEKGGSAQALAFPPTKFQNESEDNEIVVNADLAQASFLPLTAPLEISDKLKLPHHFQNVKTKKANEIHPVMEKEGRTHLALTINKEFDYLSTPEGAEIDILGMQELLENLGYLVVVKKNLFSSEMETELRQFAARPEHKTSDSTFLVFMSHGILDGICEKKLSSQEDILKDDTIFQILNNSNCQHLKDKPNVIIMQAWRGASLKAGKMPILAFGQENIHVKELVDRDLRNPREYGPPF
ncbi:LOW QUALITY PROTEIN: caspase-12-like [Dugong dugon]